MIETLITLFNRDLNKLKIEIQSYQNESKIWYTQKEISNSAGNLCLHIIGNLNTYIGSQIGKTNYIRNRELEFSNKNVPKSVLLTQIDETIIMLNHSLKMVSNEDLIKEHPILIFENKTSTEFLLIHLTTHLAYHLGQINFHRRLLDS
ncbi:DUF1572 family protein [Flavobacterium sp. IMCC34518]|uniref:DUF1572 family protein n=1 Tax=Flavobacterium sp. IMCC34518 TaxID=3003623 RepID=UPI0022AC2861|nr:DUF1572 family protein [Flavobacterium sp. IMCC34518]